MNFMTFHSVGNVIIPTDELIFLEGLKPPTSYNSDYTRWCPSSDVCWFIIPSTIDISTINHNNGLIIMVDDG